MSSAEMFILGVFVGILISVIAILLIAVGINIGKEVKNG